MSTWIMSKEKTFVCGHIYTIVCYPAGQSLEENVLKMNKLKTVLKLNKPPPTNSLQNSFELGR